MVNSILDDKPITMVN